MGDNSRGLRGLWAGLDPREQPCSPNPSRIPGTGPWGLQRVGDREEKGWRSRVRRKEVAQRCPARVYMNKAVMGATHIHTPRCSLPCHPTHSRQSGQGPWSWADP